MKKWILISTVLAFCFALSACSGLRAEEASQSDGSLSSSIASVSEGDPDRDTSGAAGSSPAADERDDAGSSAIPDAESGLSGDASELAGPASSEGEGNDAELAAALQEKIDRIAPSGIFASRFDEASSDEGGYYLYTSGCWILGDSLEETYQYADRTIQNDHYEDYPYTPAPVMDAALQEYFAIPPENLHRMIENYDADIDGYWAPMGGGGATAATVIASCTAEGGTATLRCETRSGANSTEEPGILSAVTMEYSEEFGWRFSSCSLEEG